MKLRTVNKLVSEMEKTSPEVTREFLDRIKVLKERYHDEFEGRHCSLIVKSSSVLRSVIKEASEQIVAENNVVRRTQGGVKRRRVATRALESEMSTLVTQHPLCQFATAFEAQDGIMHFMYGAQLVEKYRRCIGDYRRAVDAIGCSVTVSMHMLIDHAVHFCDELGCGLLHCSEESSESLHAECARLFKQFKVPVVGQPKHAEYLL